MSVLSQDRIITGAAIHQFIPEDTDSTQLATVSKGTSHSYESERDLLYKILYELRGNVSDLRREMNTLRKQLDDAKNTVSSEKPSTNLPTMRPDMQSVIASQQPVPAVQDAVAEEISEPETLNLETMGKQMLEKALERNGGNRKKAAQELGISDRTIYRRIKQYGLDK